MTARETSDHLDLAAALRSRWSRGIATLRRAKASPASTTLAVELSNGSSLIEAGRTLRANLTPDRTGVPPPLLVLSRGSASASARVSAALALALAEEGRRTLLVDADLRRPMLAAAFDVPAYPGFAGALESGTATPVQVHHRDLWLLPAGVSSASPAALLRRPEARRLMEEIHEGFDAVIFRAPADPDHAEGLVLSSYIRSAVLVIESGAETANDIHRIRQPLARAGVKILGYVLVC